MDRTALSNRLAGFSGLFKEGTAFNEELKAMSYVIANMDEKDLKKVVTEEKEAAKEEPKEEPKEEKDVEEEESEEEEEDKPSKEDSEDDKEASVSDTLGTFWSKQASEAVAAFLRKDVLGEDLTKSAAAHDLPEAKLPSAQTPDGSKGNKPAGTLKEKQVPSIEKTIESDIVEKSHGSVRKEASVKVEAPKVEATVISSEGVELSAAMEEVELTASEMSDLSKIF